MILMLVCLLAVVLVVIVACMINAIERAEAEYDADPEGFMERHPEHRDFF